MSRHRLDHLVRKNVHASYGHDHVLGFFVETFREGSSKPLAVLDRFKLGRDATLDDCFAFMIEQEFFTRDELEAALMAIAEDKRVRSKAVRRVVEVIVKIKRVLD